MKTTKLPVGSIVGSDLGLSGVAAMRSYGWLTWVLWHSVKKGKPCKLGKR
jgi:hypothetical protein